MQQILIGHLLASQDCARHYDTKGTEQTKTPALEELTLEEARLLQSLMLPDSQL